MSTPIESLMNIGPKSAGWLRAAGCETVEKLREIGPVAAFQLVARSQCGATVNLLWSLAAGLENRDWRDLTELEKQTLSVQLERK